jgi:hypothetical protein
MGSLLIPNTAYPDARSAPEAPVSPGRGLAYEDVRHGSAYRFGPLLDRPSDCCAPIMVGGRYPISELPSLPDL